MTGCWFAENLPDPGPCDGRLVKCHLLPKQLLRREFPHGVQRVCGYGWKSYPWRRIARKRMAAGYEVRSLRQLQDDPRCWVLGCGGIMGNAGHHGQLDIARTLRIPRAALPNELEVFASELNLTWFLDREYGQLERSAA